MKILFTIDKLPTAEQLNTFGKEAYLFYTEGSFKIIEGDIALFSEDSFPIIEFYEKIKGWQKNEGLFEFWSMDYDEDAILSFNLSDGVVRIKSDWNDEHKVVDFKSDVFFEQIEAFVISVDSFLEGLVK